MHSRHVCLSAYQTVFLCSSLNRFIAASPAYFLYRFLVVNPTNTQSTLHQSLQMAREREKQKCDGNEKEAINSALLRLFEAGYRDRREEGMGGSEANAPFTPMSTHQREASLPSVTVYTHAITKSVYLCFPSLPLVSGLELRSSWMFYQLGTER